MNKALVGALLGAGALLGWTAWQAADPEPDPSATAVPMAPAPSPPVALALAPAASSPVAVQSQAAPAASEPVADREAGIGSEGYGPHVQRALDSGDPQQALEAVRWMAKCHPDQDVEAMLTGNHAKYRLVLAPEAREKVIHEARKAQRLCQTLTPELRAQHANLAQRALDAKLPGAGLAYYQSLDRENRSPAERTQALKGLVRDVEQGQDLAVPPLALADLGQSRVERLAYERLMRLMVLKDLLPPAPPGALSAREPDPPYTPEEQAAAGALVQRLWKRLQPPG